MKIGLLYALATFLFFFAGINFSWCQSFHGLAQVKTSLNYVRPDTNRVLVLLKQSKDLIMKTGVTSAGIDSAIRLNREAGELANKLNFLRGKGYTLLIGAQILSHTRQKAACIRTAQQALVILQQLNDINGQADAYNIIGDIHSNDEGQLLPKIGYFQKAIKLYIRSGQKERAANLLTYLGDLEIWNGQYRDAIKDLKNSLSLFKAVGFEKVHAVYDLLGYGYLYLGDINEALKYNLLAVQTAEKYEDSSTLLCTIYGRTGLTYSYADNLPKCIFYMKKSLNQAYKLKDSVAIVQISLNLSAALLRNKRSDLAIQRINSVRSFKLVQEDITWKARFATLLIRAYSLHKDFKSAEVYLNECKKLLASKGIDQNVYVEIFSGIILYYQATNQFEKTYSYIAAHTKYRNAAKAIIRLDDNDDLHLFRADSASGKMLSAVRHLQRFMLFSDSLKSEKNKKQAALLEVQFDADKKDRDIQFKAKNIDLLTKQAQLQKISFRQERIIRNWIIAASGLLLLVIAVLYNRFRLKQRNNRRLEAQHLALTDKQEEINKKNDDLIHLSEKQSTLLKEKEWLLREIHHRVKNNLQITMSLLNIQSSYLESGFALDAIVNSQRRMQAMSLIHTKLYQSDNLAYIDMSNYIPELVGYLKDSFNEGDFIIFELHTPSFELDISQAIPIGLILNEAITNCLKYAFKGRDNGRIKIIMELNEEKIYTLTIADDGIGMPEKNADEYRDSLGMNLMRGLTGQIQGEFDIESKSGTTITVRFKDVKLMVEELEAI